MTPLLTRQEAAKLLKISTGTLDRLAAAGHISSVRISSRCIRYTPEALEAYVSSLTAPAKNATPWPFGPQNRRRRRKF